MKSRMPCLICRTMRSGDVKRPTPTTGLRRKRLDAADQVFLRRFGLEPRRAGASLPRAMRKIPEIRKLGMHGDEIAQVRVAESRLAHHFIERKPDRDGAAIAHSILRVGNQFLQQARAVVQRAAIFISALIGSLG